MNNDKKFKKAAVWSAATLYVLPVVGNAFVDHPCRDIQVDASCREPSDIAPHDVPARPANSKTVTVLSTSSSAMSSATFSFPSQFN